MTFDPFRELLENDERELAEEVSDWFFTNPSFGEMREYFAKLPEDVQPIVADGAGRIIIEKLYEEKLHFFVDNNCRAFVADLGESEQLFYMSSFVKYAASSVNQH